MSQKIYLFILKLGIYASFLIFLLVFKNLLFPYITSKQIPFNILIEVLLIFWLAFIIKYPAWNIFKSREKKNKNLITYGLIGFFAILTITCFTGIDFNLSFWGDVERMLGVFHLLHFLVFYFIIITVMRDWKDWKIIFIISLIITTIISIKGLNGVAHSTIGNTTYVTGLIIFNIYFSAILFIKEKKLKLIRWLYLIPVVIMLVEMKSCGTSGAFVGLGFSVICFFLFYGILSAINKKKVRAFVFLGIFIIFVLGTFLIFTNNTNKYLNKIYPVREISVNKNTFQTRLVSWQAAGKDFKNHWLLGNGFGNYAITFDKYFDPKFYDYSRAETYFDRAHNNVVDITSTTGILGITAYLLIFIFTGIYLIKSLIRGRLGILEFSLISCLFIAYFVQNLAVFDSFVTYVSLMITLGYVHFITNSKEEYGNSDLLLSDGNKIFDNKEAYSLIAVGIIALTIMYQYNILPLKMLTGVIDGQILFGKGNILEAVAAYDKALKYDTVIDRDGRDTLIRSLISNYPLVAKLDEQKIKEIISFGIDVAEKNVSYNSIDSLMNMQLARMYDTGFRVVADEKIKLEYSNKALEKIEKSLESSPKRIPVYFIKAQFLTNQGKINEAIEVLEYAYSLNRNYFETSCQLGQVYLIAGQDEKGFENIDNCLKNGGVNYIGYRGAIEKSINYYAEKKDYDNLLLLYESLMRFDQDNPKVWINLAKLNAQAGRFDRAEVAAKQAAKLDKNLEKDVEDFINNLNEEKNKK